MAVRICWRLRGLRRCVYNGVTIGDRRHPPYHSDALLSREARDGCAAPDAIGLWESPSRLTRS